MNRELLLTIVSAVCLSAFTACAPPEEPDTLVVYTSVDQAVSEPVLAKFEADTGIKVQAVYDSGTGLAYRLIAEKGSPQADVFWNAEFAQTFALQAEGVLANYRSPNASDIPSQYVDPRGYWTAFGGRARVFLVNTAHLAPENYPNSFFNMFNDLYPPEKIGIASPLQGSTAAHAAALYAAMGAEEARSIFQALADRGIQVMEDNSVVRDMVVDGELIIGLMDSDAACEVVKQGAPVEIIVPDQREDQIGTLIIPSTVALIAGAPHPTAAQNFIDYLLSIETEKALVASGWVQVPSRPVDGSSACIDNAGIRGMPVSLAEIYSQYDLAEQEMATIFTR